MGVRPDQGTMHSRRARSRSDGRPLRTVGGADTGTPPGTAPAAAPHLLQNCAPSFKVAPQELQNAISHLANLEQGSDGASIPQMRRENSERQQVWIRWKFLIRPRTLAYRVAIQAAACGAALRTPTSGKSGQTWGTRRLSPHNPGSEPRPIPVRETLIKYLLTAEGCHELAIFRGRGRPRHT